MQDYKDKKQKLYKYSNCLRIKSNDAHTLWHTWDKRKQSVGANCLFLFFNRYLLLFSLKHRQVQQKQDNKKNNE